METDEIAPLMAAVDEYTVECCNPPTGHINYKANEAAHEAEVVRLYGAVEEEARKLLQGRDAEIERLREALTLIQSEDYDVDGAYLACSDLPACGKSGTYGHYDTCAVAVARAALAEKGW